MTTSAGEAMTLGIRLGAGKLGIRLDDITLGIHLGDVTLAFTRNR